MKYKGVFKRLDYNTTRVNDNNNIKGALAEKYILEWLKNEPQFKSFQIIEQPNNTKGIDFELSNGLDKIAIQVKQHDTTITSSKLHHFIKV